jgi:hypothetical protein
LALDFFSWTWLGHSDEGKDCHDASSTSSRHEDFPITCQCATWSFALVTIQLALTITVYHVVSRSDCRVQSIKENTVQCVRINMGQCVLMCWPFVFLCSRNSISSMRCSPPSASQHIPIPLGSSNKSTLLKMNEIDLIRLENT